MVVWGRILALLGVVWCVTGALQDVWWLTVLGGGCIGIGSSLELGEKEEK